MFKNWTDTVSGKLTLGMLMIELAMQMIHRQPKRIIVDIQFHKPTQKKEGGYWTKVWISNRDFARWR